MTSPPRFLVDTSLIVALTRGDPGVRERLVQAGEVWLSAITVGELYDGALYSGSPARNVARVAQVVADSRVLDCDTPTAQIFGDLRADLRRRGRLIPDNDIWIAAAAVQHDLVLATRDAHFDIVPGLRVERW